MMPLLFVRPSGRRIRLPADRPAATRSYAKRGAGTCRGVVVRRAGWSRVVHSFVVRITELPTPQVIVEASRLDENIARMQRAADARGLRLRPHAKTHKSPAIARRQLARGARGICCAKLAEAEVFAAAGIDDIRLPYPVQPANAARVLALMDRAAISIIVDHAAVARGWSEAMQRAGRTLDVLVKVDVGFHRCGIDPDAPDAVAFIRDVAGLPGLRLRGLLSHAGHAYHATAEDELRRIAQAEAAIHARLADAAREAGVAIEERSVGATPTARFSVGEPGLTELRPGNYVYFDRSQVALGSARLDECALTVMATVVSKPAPDRLVLDCGSKTLSSDAARGFERPPGYGLVFPDLESDRPDASLLVERLSEEHATVRVAAGRTHLEPGDRVRVLPNHACVVSNLVDRIVLADGLVVVDTLEVAARGKIW
jgi:D-serine deaminase-like pyridoxal phosphate-dependent protein